MSVKANRDPRAKKALLEEIEQLRTRLDEAEQTLDAIRCGDVDALVVAGPHGDQIFSLTGSERTYRLIVETMNEAALTVGLDGTILFCNQRFCDLVNATMADAVGKKLTTFVAPAQQRPLRMLLSDSQDGPAQQHITLQASDGTEVSALVAANLLEAAASTTICLVMSDLTELEAQAGSIKYLLEQQQALEGSRAELEVANKSLNDSRRAALNVAEDALIARRQIEEANAELRRETAERKNAEERLKESEGRLRLFIEHAPAALAMFDSEMRYLSVSNRWRSDYNLGDRELLGLSHYEVFPEITEKWREAHRKGLDGEVERDAGERFVRIDGSVQWVRWEIRPWFDATGKIGGIIIFAEDITEQKLAEDALRESERRLRSLADSIPNLAWWANSDGYITWYNKRWYEYTGTTPEQMEGWGWQSVHDPDELPKVMERWQASIASGDPFDMTFPLRGGDGVYRLFLTRIIPLKDSAGRVQQWFGTNTDVSELEHRVAERTKELATTIDSLHSEIRERELAEKKLLDETTVRIQATEALREKEQMLIQQSRQAAMGEMIGNIAHQWRQPLNTLGLTIQQLSLFYDLGEFTKELLDNNVSRSMELIQHMSQTIDDFRNYFKPDKKKIDFKVQKALANTMTLIGDSFKSQHIDVELVTTDDPVIHGFKNEFAQVVLNILNNARDVLTERGIKDPRVKITLGSENGRAVVTISDNAGGIPEEIIGKIFDPYFTTKGPQSGTGVGLFMSKTIIEKNMGGSLTVQNIADGAEFRIEM